MSVDVSTRPHSIAEQDAWAVVSIRSVCSALRRDRQPTAEAIMTARRQAQTVIAHTELGQSFATEEELKWLREFLVETEAYVSVTVT